MNKTYMASLLALLLVGGISSQLLAEELPSGTDVFENSSNAGSPLPPEHFDGQNIPPEAREHFKQKMLEKFDADGDGQLSDSEKQTARQQFEEKKAQMREEFEKRKTEILGKYDADGDGKLSEQERENFKADKKQEILEKYDTDGDGQLNEAEKKTAREEFHQKHPNAHKLKKFHEKRKERREDRSSSGGTSSDSDAGI